MSLPASLLAAVESHGCFSGCYDDASPVSVCLHPMASAVPIIQVHCNDCLTYHLGALASLLPNGMHARRLADDLSAHVRSRRGFRWAKSGYFTSGGGFWIAAAYFGDGLFLVDGTRSAGKAGLLTDLDVLVHAFQQNILQPEDLRMVDPALYTSDTIYVRFVPQVVPIRTKQDLLASPHVSRTHRTGYRRASVLEFQPLATAVAAPTLPSSAAAVAQGTATAPPTPAPAAPPRDLRIGDVCPRCHAKVQERALFSSTYVGCLC